MHMSVWRGRGGGVDMQTEPLQSTESVPPPPSLCGSDRHWLVNPLRAAQQTLPDDGYGPQPHDAQNTLNSNVPLQVNAG